MTWIPLVSTALGAAIALSGALFASVRSGRDQLRRERETQRRQVYVAFATALDKAHAGLRSLINDPTASDRKGAARAAVGEAGLYTAREQLLMFSPGPVATAGESAFLTLIVMRDVASTIQGLDSAGYHDAYHPLATTIWKFRMVVREDIGERSLSPNDFRHTDWSERNECQICVSRD